MGGEEGGADGPGLDLDHAVADQRRVARQLARDLIAQPAARPGDDLLDEEAAPEEAGSAAAWPAAAGETGAGQASPEAGF